MLEPAQYGFHGACAGMDTRRADTYIWHMKRTFRWRKRKLAEIGAEMEAKWPGVKVAIAHRIGELHISDIAVLIAVSSPHRKAAYEANEYAIERIKEVVPIWKKEIWEDGEEWIGGQKKVSRKGGDAEVIKVNYFARLRELTGKAEETIERESMTVRELLELGGGYLSGFRQGYNACCGQ